jgi:Flp pilus assembly protein protease CpaA
MDLILSIKIFILLIAAGIAAYTDYKTGYIYNWITFPLIIIGFLFLVLESFIYPVLGYLYFFKILFFSILVYGVGYLFYYFGKLGGGDVKFFIGLVLLVPYVNDQLFILWVLIISSLSSVLIVSIKYLFILFKKLSKKQILKIVFERRIKIIFYFILFVLFTYFLVSSINILGFPKIYLLLILPIFLGLFSVVFEPEIKKYIYLKRKLLKDLEDGDVLAIDFLSKDVFKKLNMKNRVVLEEKDLLRIRKLKIKSLPIFDNLPRFGPYIFLGVLLSFVFLFFVF